MGNAIGYLALPDCAMKKEGTKKERANVFDRLDDKCAEDKTNKITKSLKTVLGLGTVPSGQVVFRSCKDIFVKIILEQFKKMQGFISSQCDQSLSTGPASRRKRSYGGGYYPGGYDPSTIWFQYLLCHEQKISCYFFTQGWNEKEYGQYYLYENLFDTGFDKLGHASSGTDDLLTLALLGGLGGSHQYPHHVYPSYRKRRDADDEKGNEDEDTIASGRRRRSNTAATEEEGEDTNASGRRRRSNTAAFKDEGEDTTVASKSRRRRHTAATEEEGEDTNASSRKRRSNTAASEDEGEDTTVASGSRRRRHTAAIKDEGESSKVVSGSRRRRHTAASMVKGEGEGEDSKGASGGRRRRDTTKSTSEVASRGRRRRDTTKSTSEVASGGRRRRDNTSGADSNWIDCKNDDGSL